MYNIGASGIGATAELKEVTSIYSDTVDEAYKLFCDDPYEGVVNMAYLNDHLNRPIAVSDELYAALQLVQQTGNRFLFMAPLVSQYEGLFSAVYDQDAEMFDPLRSEEARADLNAMARYANDPAMIDLKLEAGNLVTIVVSDEYLRFAEDYGIEYFAGFTWLRNAFIVDMTADRLIAAGHLLGTISSFDGYCRSLDDSGRSYSFNVYELLKGNIQIVGVMNAARPLSIVYFRNFPKSELDRAVRYYTYSNGENCAPYFDPADGMPKSACNALIAYSDCRSTAELALKMLPLYTTDVLDEAAIAAMQADALYAVWCDQNEIRYTGDFITFSDLYQDGKVTYSPKKMP